MNLAIPQLSGEPLQIPLEVGGQLFIVGANGSGKSSLIQHFVSTNEGLKIKRISAHRQTWLSSGSLDFTAHSRKEFERDSIGWETQFDARWVDHAADQKQSAVLFDLVAKENSRARDIARHIDSQNPDEAVKFASESVAPFDQLNELLELGTLTVALKNSNDEEILAQHRNSNTSFSIAQMSDGERNAAIIAATVLTVEPETILLIDEPERHLHRSIIEPFLSALFERRRDCVFVVSTHEIALPVANPSARVLMVRSCEWDNNTAKAWEVEVLESNADLPEELKLDILGARRRILFAEGRTNSLDLPLYSALFPGLSVVPKGSCAEVQKAVSGLRGSQDIHHVEAFGLIDKDDRPEDEINELAKNNVFALDVCSAEAIYYCSNAITAVAHRQAESLGGNADQMIESVTQKVLETIVQDGLAERMAARRCERTVRNLTLSVIPDWRKIQASDEKLQIAECIDSPYPEELKHFNQLVASRNLDALVARYPLRDSRVFNVIAACLKCCDKDAYQKMVLSRIQADADLARNLKQRISALSKVLDVES